MHFPPGPISMGDHLPRPDVGLQALTLAPPRAPAGRRVCAHAPAYPGFAVYLASLTATWTGFGSGPASDSICQAPI